MPSSRLHVTPKTGKMDPHRVAKANSYEIVDCDNGAGFLIGVFDRVFPQFLQIYAKALSTQNPPDRTAR